MFITLQCSGLFYTLFMISRQTKIFSSPSRASCFVYIVRNLLVRIAQCLCVCAEFISVNFTLIRTNKFRTFLFRTILF